MGKFHVVYFGSNDVPVELIKPILAEIDADMTIRRPTNDAEVVEMGAEAHILTPERRIATRHHGDDVLGRHAIRLAGVGELRAVGDEVLEVAEAAGRR